MTPECPKGQESEARPTCNCSMCQQEADARNAPMPYLRRHVAEAIYDAVKIYNTADVDVAADAVVAMVEPELERLTAEVERLRAGNLEYLKVFSSWESLWNDKEDWEKAAKESWQREKALEAEVSRLREQLAEQPSADLVARAALWLFRAKTSRLMPDVLQRASWTWHRVLDQQDRDAWMSYAREMLADFGWGVSAPEAEAPQPQEMTQHEVDVTRKLAGWVARCRSCVSGWSNAIERDVQDWKDQHEADTLRPVAVTPEQAADQLSRETQELFEGRPSGSGRLAPRPSNLALWTDDDEIVWEVRVVDIRHVATIRLVDEPDEVREVLVHELSRLPRAWHKGDPEPEDHPQVFDRHGDVWTHVPGTFEWSSPETQNCSWSYMARKWAPLTEVVSTEPQDAAQAAQSEATPHLRVDGDTVTRYVCSDHIWGEVPCPSCEPRDLPSPSLRKEGEIDG